MLNLVVLKAGFAQLETVQNPKILIFPEFFCGFVRYYVYDYTKRFHKDPLRNVGEVAGQISFFKAHTHFTEQHRQRPEIYIIMAME